MYTRNVPKEIKDMLKEVASTQKLEYRLVEDIYFQQFEFVAKMMAEGKSDDYSSYENILLKQLGSFIANEKHINKLQSIANAKQEDNGEVQL